MTIEFCNICDEETRWEPLRRGSRREKCVKCRTVFPCKHDCEHLDCDDEKRRWKNKRD